MLDQAFDALKKYEWGVEPKTLKPIDESIVSTHGNSSARQELESRLAELLAADVPRAAKDYICRVLRIVGTAASVPALAKLLAEKEHSHMARYALERIPAPQAAETLRGALASVAGALKIGVISSLGARRDEASVPALAALLGDSAVAVARAAALALGAIRTAAAAKALAQAASANGKEVKAAVTDASLACAEALLNEGKKSEALSL
ncbi:MAG: HEAT repeat domain-containing protein, partial [Pirellulales bacterium]